MPNAGIAQDAHCVDISSEDVDALVGFGRKQGRTGGDRRRRLSSWGCPTGFGKKASVPLGLALTRRSLKAPGI